MNVAFLVAPVRILGAQGSAVLPNGLVAPIRLDRVGPRPTVIDVDLPAIVTDVPTGPEVGVRLVRFSGTVTPNINIGQNVTPQLTTSSSVTLS